MPLSRDRTTSGFSFVAVVVVVAFGYRSDTIVDHRLRYSQVLLVLFTMMSCLSFTAYHEFRWQSVALLVQLLICNHFPLKMILFMCLSA